MAVGDLLFAFDPSKESPESVKKKRAIAEAILATNRAPRTIGEGLNALGDGIVANVMNRRASEAEGMGQQSAQKAIAALIAGSDFGGSSGSSASGFAAEAPSIQPDYASQRVAQAHNESGGSDWLKYANQGATRSMPLSGDLTSALSFLPELGVQMEVFSGGQPAKGSGGARVGSTRHDHGNAADVFFYKDGRRLDWSNPEDVPIYEEIVRRGRAAGITGFGAGEGYMRPGSMHIGFGGEAVWGAGGKGANAPDWLRNAYNSPMQASNPVQAINGIMNDGPVQVAESEADVQAMEAAMAQQNPQAFNMPTGGAAPQQPVQMAQASMPNQMSDAEALRLLGARAEPQPMQQAPQPMQAMNSGPTMEQLLQASQNPWLSESQRGIVNMLLQQQMQQNDPMRQMEMERARLELEQMRNPQEKLINAGDGNLYNPNSGEWISAPGRDQDGFRRATPEEAAQYGAPGGQFGPDGRFYPINPPSGTALSVDPTTGAVTFQQGSGVKPLTEGQSKDTVYATRAEGSLGTLDKFGDTLTNPLERAAEYDPTGLFRSNQSPEFQQAKQAGDEFLQAILRKDTGAAITTDEMQSYGRTYLPMPGDGPEVLRQKQVARKRALEALKAGMPPQAILQQEKALANTADQSNSDAIPSDVDPADWEFMTPEEKALFQ
ncbi:hypothetical protein JYP46_01535 [Nitratireductor aquimarinus]|uniref:hypothetical protein n=1 Tax=Alphaproteobacteria TaxID=28211 RepID=UPI0019D38AFF|nr:MULTISPECIES: hypothetical protein [Alphaproteobacteria]MBN7755493.1 hypothetical protein [Nitratireductor aquimarinus]MBY5998248.1 hypothetical protein [Tritonibacter mobilis]MBY6020276.1 hypothetical protein [Nitratireductor sp. DP7N14-4]